MSLERDDTLFGCGIQGVKKWDFGKKKEKSGNWDNITIKNRPYDKPYTTFVIKGEKECEGFSSVLFIDLHM